jgi:hypothetical protein
MLTQALYPPNIVASIDHGDNPDTVAAWTGERRTPAAMQVLSHHIADMREIERQASARVFGRRSNLIKGE